MVTYPWFEGPPSTPSSALPCPAVGGRGTGPCHRSQLLCRGSVPVPDTWGTCPTARASWRGVLPRHCPRCRHNPRSPVQPAGHVEERAGLQHDPLGPGRGRDLLRLLPHRRGSHQQADPGVTSARDPAALRYQGAAHLQLHRAVAVRRYSGARHGIPGQPLLGAGCPPAGPTYPPWHPEKRWLWPRTGHTHSLLPWGVGRGGLAVWGGWQRCLSVWERWQECPSVCLSEGHGRCGAHLSVQAMWKPPTWAMGQGGPSLCPGHVAGGVCLSVCQDRVAEVPLPGGTGSEPLEPRQTPPPPLWASASWTAMGRRRWRPCGCCGKRSHPAGTPGEPPGEL